MSPDLEQVLYDRYPAIFAERNLPADQTAMCRGITCGDGWFTLLDALCASLQREADHGDAQQIVATQVKEKLGGLRFHVRTASGIQRGMIRLATNLSERICEMCGAPGELRQVEGEPIAARCPVHRNATQP